MTTLSSTSITASPTPAIPRGRVALVALWLTQIALAVLKDSTCLDRGVGLIGMGSRCVGRSPALACIPLA